MSLRLGATLVIVWLAAVCPVRAQFKQGEPEGTKSGKSEVSRWRAGMVITASGGPCRALVGYVPIPTEWPEQDVKTVEEDISPEAKVTFETVDGGVKVMNVRIGQLAAGQEAKALVTLEICRREVLPPEKTDRFVIPDAKRLPREIRPYLLPSPKIESTNPKIRDLAKTVGVDKEKAWDRVEAIYDWVRSKVKYQNGPLKGAMAALRDGTGDCEELTSLFIAICRAVGVPARTVWVSGHCYPEFYLEDDQGQGHWFPCQSAGARQFGGISDLRPILQKGDNFRPPKGGKERQRYMAEHLSGKPTPGGGKPQVRFVREPAGK
jgi:hypothetical protein